MPNSNLDNLIEQVAFTSESVSDILNEFSTVHRYWVHKQSGKTVYAGAEHMSVVNKLGLPKEAFEPSVITKKPMEEKLFPAAYKKGWVRAGIEVYGGEVYLDTSSKLSRQDVINIVGDILVYEKIKGTKTWKVIVGNGDTGDIGYMGKVFGPYKDYTIEL